MPAARLFSARRSSHFDADDHGNVVETTAGTFRARYVINCAGLYSDAITRMAGLKTNLEIIPFRGEYYEIRPERRSLIKNLIYPVPDPRFPFLGVHFTRRVNGSVEAGPNAVLAFRREGYTGTSPDLSEATEMLRFGGFWKMAKKYWQKGMAEQYRAWVKSAFTESCRRWCRSSQEADLAPGGSGVRAQAVDANGNLVDDFYFVHSGSMIHVCNVPSPAATASLEIGKEIVSMMAERFGLEQRTTCSGVKILQAQPRANPNAAQTSASRCALSLATRRPRCSFETVTRLCRLTAHTCFMPSSSVRTTSDGTPRTVEVIGATVMEDK